MNMIFNERKTIRINFLGFGFGSAFPYKQFWLYDVLLKRYNVEVVDDPDYLICSMFDIPYEYCQYPHVRIMCSGENYIPDFNLIDYSICPYPIEFYDRNYRLPQFMDLYGDVLQLQKKSRDYSYDIIKRKEYFANFIAGHESEYGMRGKFFRELSKYKRVESPGTYLHNMDSAFSVKFYDGSKINFQKKTKFTICFESTSHEGFITEKLTDAFKADTIPIYYGDPHITEIFNKSAFINVADYANFDEVIAKVIELDNDDDKYLEMLRQPIFNDPQYVQKTYEGLEEYIFHIFDQPLSEAYRRSRVYYPSYHNTFLIKASRRYARSPRIVLGRFKSKIISKIKRKKTGKGRG